MAFSAKNLTPFLGNSSVSGAFSERGVTKEPLRKLPSPPKLFSGAADFQGRQEIFLIRRSFFSERRFFSSAPEKAPPIQTDFSRGPRIALLRKKLRRRSHFLDGRPGRPVPERSFTVGKSFRKRPKQAARGL